MLKAVIIDDEREAIDSLTFDVENYCPDIKLIGTSQSIDEGYVLIKEYSPDIVFLDIDLGKNTGFDLVTRLKENELFDQTNVIFTTGFNQFAIKALKNKAFDYLVKPVDPDELVDSIERLKEELANTSTEQSTKFKKVNFDQSGSLTLNTQEKVYVCKYKEIVRCQSERNYTKFYMSSGKSILVSKTLGEYADRLEQNGFFRPHKAHVINLSFVDSYIKQDGGYILMTDESTVPLSKNKKEEFFAVLNRN
ncbi:MAG: LytTR family DNA-binding domain-containing protein [Flavobacteriales bacterium]|nr:LytTR family DNA-binding domain-containing protein [Flavobacteriales bacterium]